MSDDFIVELHPAAIAELLRSPAGPVGALILPEAAADVTKAAQGRAPVASGYIAPGRPPPGTLRNSIRPEPGADGEGLYTDVKAVFYDRYLEKPASQIPVARRTLEDALHDLPPVIPT